MSDEKQQFNVYLPPELIRAIKHRAVDEGKSLSALVEEILATYIEEGARA
jgi:predicted HicB family RNase H-like nuclease